MNYPGILSRSRIEYVLYHLNFSVELSDDLRSLFSFVPAGLDNETEDGTIVFPLVDSPLDLSDVLYIDNLPVLFSAGKAKRWYQMENNTLIFNHDLIKSAFYLLSGYQEVYSEQRDQFNRFPYSGSVQEVLGVADIPLVNYYFRIIGQGIEAFCKNSNRPFRTNKLFDSFGFILSHDVDIVDTFTLKEVLFRLKRLIIRNISKNSWSQDLGYFLYYLREYLRVFDRKNPHWDFKYLVESAKERGFTQVFYFLHRDKKGYGSKYTFDEPRIKELFQYLRGNACEIGLHGSIRSANNEECMQDHRKNLLNYSATNVSGVRQHYLVHLGPETTRIQERAGFSYDFSLGFAEHEGFRHAYCLPFRLYDFAREQMFDLWHIPLIAMDATIYLYRGLDRESALAKMGKLIDECVQFHGIFTLLWHNGNFGLEDYPEGKALYEKILDLVLNRKGISITGEQCVNDYLTLGS